MSRLDAILGFPTPFDVVDVGAGRAELLRTLATLARDADPRTDPPRAALAGTHPEPPPLAHRLRLTAVELAPRPPDLLPDIDWTTEIPQAVTGLLIATEWLDNVPLDLADHTPANGYHYRLVHPRTGTESPGPPLTPQDTAWLTHWHPTPPPPPCRAR